MDYIRNFFSVAGTIELAPSQNTPGAGSAAIEQISKSVFKDVIAPHLSTKDLAALSKTSKAMRGKVGPFLNEKWELKKAAITIGPDIWKQVSFVVEDVPSLPKDIDAILTAECPYFAGKRVYQTHRLLLMPAGLSMNELGVLTRHLRDGENESIFQPMWHRVTLALGEQELKKSYWVLVTDNVIPGSYHQSFENKERLLKRGGYEAPTALEAIALVTMNLQKSCERKEFLLPINSFTCTECKETLHGCRITVGNFGPSGLWVSNIFDFSGLGIMGLRKLN